MKNERLSSKERNFNQWPFKPTLPQLEVAEGHALLRFRIAVKPGNAVTVVLHKILLRDKLERDYSQIYKGDYKKKEATGKSFVVQVPIEKRNLLKSDLCIVICFLAGDHNKYEVEYINSREKGMILYLVSNTPMNERDEEEFESSLQTQISPIIDTDHSDDYDPDPDVDGPTPYRIIPDFDKFKNAVLREKYFIQEKGGRKYKVTNGIRSSIRKGQITYSFEMEAELYLSDDASISLTVGSNMASGTVLMCEGFQIFVVIDRDFGSNISQALLSVEPWKLLEALADRLDKIKYSCNRITSLLLDDGPKLASQNPADTIPSGQEAALHAARKNEITVIWGPPGTGKTYTMAQIAKEGLQKNNRILIVSHSNVSVDGAVKQIAQALRNAEMNDLLQDGKVLRYGYVRDEELILDQEAVAYNYVLTHHPDLRFESERLHKIKENLIKSGQYRSESGTQVEKELKNLRTAVRLKEREYVQRARIVATTISKVTVDPLFDDKHFDTVMFDEVSMAYIPQIICAASFAAHKLILVGDFRQLSPIVQSEVKKTLEMDIFTYLGIAREGKVYAHPWLVMLNEQRRMHPAISAFSNRYVYRNLVKDYSGVIADKQSIANKAPLAGSAASLINLTGTYCAAMKNSDNSRFNILSAILSLSTAVQAESCGENSIGIITPYAAQTRLIRAMIQDSEIAHKTNISCSTVHQFQGSERNIIIFDAVESYPASKVGWLMGKAFESVTRLINVAVTRAKGKLIVVANEKFWENRFGGTKHPLYQLIQYLMSSGEVVSGKEKRLVAYFNSLPQLNNVHFYQDYENALKDFKKDIEGARGKIVISIPDGNLDERVQSEVLKIILKAKSNGIRVLSKAGDYRSLPEGWKKITYASENTVFPLIVIDDQIAWYDFPKSRGKFTDGDRGYLTVLHTVYRVKGEHTLELIKMFSDLEIREIDGQRKPLIEKKDKDSDGDHGREGTQPSGLDRFIRQSEYCPKCKKPMMLSRGRSGACYIKCSSQYCKEMAYLSPELTNAYINRERIRCPKDHGVIYAALGKYGVYIRCECGHYLKPDEI